MTLQKIEYNQTILDQLMTLRERQRLAHAYLFVGPQYMGKTKTAVHFAKALMCEVNADQNNDFYCNTCASCLKIDQESHPDLYILQCEYGEKIKIEEIRALIEQVKLRPFLGNHKVFIVKNVENVTLEGANALLKTLEEPAKGNIIILTTTLPEKVLPTIRSRCHAFYFYTGTNQKLEEQLMEEGSLKPNNAHVLSYFAEGCLGKANHLKSEGFIEIKNEMLDNFVFTADSEQYIKSIASDKQKTKNLLDILLSWIRDAILLKSGVDNNRLVHIDRITELKRFSDEFSFDELNQLNNEVVNAHNLLAENLNIKIPLMIIKAAI